MSNLQAAVRGLASSAVSPDALCTRLNALLCRNMTCDRFITLFYAQLDGPSRRLRYASAGHNPPVLQHRNGSHERLTEGGGVLGVFPNETFSLGMVQLAPGDRVIFFTDGVTEANSPEGEEFGEARLLGLLEEHRQLSAGELQKKILDAAAGFCGGHWRDDATLVILAVS
jgi:sigma-B regulation protein RsbU (phosphoserine phosphatase)